MKRAALAGQRFGRLLVVAPAPKRGRFTCWACRCDCGAETIARTGNLRGGHTTSCGCAKRETSTWRGCYSGTHQHTRNSDRSATYQSWRSMRERCTSLAATHFADYGGRGISICERWGSFENFLADMGERPADTTLDRIDNDGNYEPGNCRWATPREQSRNQRSNRRVTFGGETLTVAEWAERLGVSRATLRCRLERGWSIADAVSTPRMAQFARDGRRHAA